MTIREATRHDIPGISHVRISSWRSTYRGIVPESYLDNLTLKKDIQRLQRIMGEPGKFHFVAESSVHGIVGFIAGGPNRSNPLQFPGELYALYVLAAHQRNGIGVELTRAWAGKLLRNGMPSALVWVLAANQNATAFYKRMGAAFYREQTIEIGGHHLPEFGFVWDDLSVVEGKSFRLIEQVATLMEGFPAPWFVSGGWAMDLFLGKVTRSHSDIEIGIYRRDQQLLPQHLRNWSLEKAVEDAENPWRPWKRGESLQLPVHQIRARNRDAPPNEFEFFLNERDDTQWLSRRHAGVMRAIDEVSLISTSGIPFLAPEIQLLFKAKYLRAKDEADFSNAISRMNPQQRLWLKDVLVRFHPGISWIDSIT